MVLKIEGQSFLGKGHFSVHTDVSSFTYFVELSLEQLNISVFRIYAEFGLMLF
jgi:hypothetical protein